LPSAHIARRSFAHGYGTAVRHILGAQEVSERAHHLLFCGVFAHEHQIAENELGHPPRFGINFGDAVGNGFPVAFHVHARRAAGAPIRALRLSDLCGEVKAVFRPVYARSENDRRLLNIDESEVVGKKHDRQNRRKQDIQLHGKTF